MYLKGYHPSFPVGIISNHVPFPLIGEYPMKHPRVRNNAMECYLKDVMLSNFSLEVVWEASHAAGMQYTLFRPLADLCFRMMPSVCNKRHLITVV